MSQFTPTRVRLTLDRLEDRDVPNAATLDLTTRGSHGSINGALFEQYGARHTGSGHIHSFVRLQSHGNDTVESGVNTDARPLRFDESKSPRLTHSMRVSDLPLVTVRGGLYREVLLDINQKASASRLSLDELKVFVGGTGNLSYNAASGRLGGAAPVYNLDAGGDHRVKLDARLSTGRGSGDMRFYIPNDILGGGEFFYLYSKFGQTIAANGGFEEWAARADCAPVAPQASGYSGVVYAVTVEGDQYGVSGGTLQLWSGTTLVGTVPVGEDGSAEGAGSFRFDTMLDQPKTFQLVYIPPGGTVPQPWLSPESASVTLSPGNTSLVKDLFLAPG